MNEIAGPLTRVLLRYAAGGLVAKAGLSIDVNDPDVINVATMLIGGGLALISEAWWRIAKKNGWGQ